MLNLKYLSWCWLIKFFDLYTCYFFILSTSFFFFFQQNSSLEAEVVCGRFQSQLCSVGILCKYIHEYIVLCTCGTILYVYVSGQFCFAKGNLFEDYSKQFGLCGKNQCYLMKASGLWVCDVDPYSTKRCQSTRAALYFIVTMPVQFLKSEITFPLSIHCFSL